MVNKLMPPIMPQGKDTKQSTGPVWIAPTTLSDKAYASLFSMIQ